MPLVDFLEEFGLFETLNRAQLAAIAAIADERTFGPDEVIMAEYTRGDDMYFIKEGLVDVRISTKAGPGMGLYTAEGGTPPLAPDMMTMARLLPGQALGEVALVDDGLRSATAVSVGDSVLIRIERDALLQLCEDDPRLGYVVMRNIAADLAFKMRSSGLVLRGEMWRPEGDDLTPGDLGFDKPLGDEPGGMSG